MVALELQHHLSRYREARAQHARALPVAIPSLDKCGPLAILERLLALRVRVQK